MTMFLFIYILENSIHSALNNKGVNIHAFVQNTVKVHIGFCNQIVFSAL